MSFNFDVIRSKLFGGKLSQSQVNGINNLLALYADPANGMTDARFQAYGLATAFRETGATMEPIEEWGKGKGKAYAPNWYGRGYVQLTWEYNYLRMRPLVGADLVANPSLALDPVIAGKIMVIGMTQGSFTGKKLSDYFNDKMTDPLNARRIINGIDHNVEVANDYHIFMTALQGPTA